MERNIVDYFKKVLSNRNGRLSMNSFSGHLAELSQRERKYIKKTGLEKFINKYPETFVICEEEIYLMKEKKNEVAVISNYESVEKPTSVSAGKEMVLKDMENDPCTVCSDKIEIYAIGRCQHPICYRCSTMLRVLCEDKNCPVCRQKLDMVVFSEKLVSLEEHDIDSYIQDKKHGLAFASKDVYEKKLILLQHVCKLCPNNVKFESFEQLENHTKSKHQRYYCDICVRQLKIFTSERKTYKSSDLKKHQDPEDGVGGHPMCKFCETRYLDNDELLRHLHLHHCSCFICDKANDGKKSFQFYINLQELTEHYCAKHFACDDPECMGDMGCTAVFENEIDLQGHKLKMHLGMKTKLEKKQKHILNLPNMFEREKEPARQILLNVVPDAAGGIQCTGHVISRIEEKYSFIERDDKPNEFEENVFFDLESYGLKLDDDLREHFKPFERVRVYALPGNQNCRSKWKAFKVEKLGEYIFGEPTRAAVQDYQIGYRSGTPESLEDLDRDHFPALANRVPSSNNLTSKPAQLGGWSQATSKNISSSAASAFHPSKKENQATIAKPNYEVGFIHRNLSDTFGFITKDHNEFLDNTYFNAENYRVGMGISKPIPDLRKVLNIGEKVCYVLQTTPVYKNVKAKYKADRVWKFSHNANVATAEIKKIVGLDKPTEAIPSRPKMKIKSSEAPNQPSTIGITNPTHELLALKYKQRIKFETGESQKMEIPNGGKFYSPFTVTTDTIPEIIQTYDSNANTFTPVPSAVAKKVSDFVDDTASVGSDKKITPQIAAVFHGDESKQANTQSTLSGELSSLDDKELDLEYSSSDVYSSDEESEDDCWEIEENDCQCQKVDQGYLKYGEIVEICLKNKGLTRLLLERIAEEMKNKQSNQPCNLQFIEFHKDKSAAYIMFYVMDKSGWAERVVSSVYTKLNGDYPLENSWLGELKSKNLITKVGKDLYNIAGSGHYIMVARNKSEKVSKVTLHYRPLPGTHAKIQ